MEADLMYRTPCNYEVRCGELNRYRGIQVFPCTSPKSMYWTPIPHVRGGDPVHPTRSGRVRWG
jgi:hypothetical protein